MIAPGKWMTGFAAVVAVLGVRAGAQTSYTLSETVSLFGPTIHSTIYRDGNMAVLDQSHLPDKENPKGFHLRTYDDLAKQTSYTLDLVNTSGGCGAGSFTGDWGDPFVTSKGMMDDLVKQGAKVTGTAMVDGLSAKVYEGADGDTKVKAWVDATSGLLLKAVITPPTGEVKTVIEVQQVSLVAPAASVFKLPAECAAAALAPKAPTVDEAIDAETGGMGSTIRTPSCRLRRSRGRVRCWCGW